jgi:hypothetical protein
MTMTSPQAIASDPKFGDCSIRAVKLRAADIVVDFESDNTRETTQIVFHKVRFFQFTSNGSNVILDRIDYHESLAASLGIPVIKQIVCDEQNLDAGDRSAIERSGSGVYHLVPVVGSDGIVICDSAELAAWTSLTDRVAKKET